MYQMVGLIWTHQARQLRVRELILDPMSAIVYTWGDSSSKVKLGLVWIGIGGCYFHLGCNQVLSKNDNWIELD